MIFQKTKIYFIALICVLIFINNSSKANINTFRYKKEKIFELSIKDNSYFPIHTRQDKYTLDCPYNIIVDQEETIWIVSRENKKCITINQNQEVTVFAEGNEFEEIDREYGFSILAVDKKRLLLENCILSRNTKRVLLDFRKPIKEKKYFPQSYVVSAGFTKDSGAYYNTYDQVYVLNGNGKVIIPESSRDDRFGQKNKLLSFYYDPLSRENFILKYYQNLLYLKNSSGSFRKKMPYISAYQNIYFIDRFNRFYIGDCYFKCHCIAEESSLYRLNQKGDITKILTLHRSFDENMPDHGQEDYAGFLPDGSIFYSKYFKDDKIEIYKLTEL